jgi:hypothetical protein
MFFGKVRKNPCKTTVLDVGGRRGARLLSARLYSPSKAERVCVYYGEKGTTPPPHTARLPGGDAGDARETRGLAKNPPRERGQVALVRFCSCCHVTAR